MQKIITIFILFLIVFSSYLAIAQSSGSTVCLTGSDHASCATVQSSKYGKIFGIKVATLGPIAFILLFIAQQAASKKSRYQEQAKGSYILFTTLGALFALYFITLQVFVLNQICSTCLVIDVTMLLVALLTYIDIRHNLEK